MRIYTTLALLCVTAAASVSDYKESKIPNRLVQAGFILACAARLAERRPISEDLMGFFLTELIFLAAYRLHMIGGGDVKLILFLAFLLPFGISAPLLWIAMLIASAAGIAGLILCKLKMIRLGPALFLASLTVSFIYGGAF